MRSFMRRYVLTGDGDCDMYIYTGYDVGTV